MAVNFLACSPAYRASTSTEMRALDELIVRALGPTYKVPKGSANELLDQVVSQFPYVTKVRLNGRVRMFRTAYAVLTGHATPTHKEDVRRGHGAAAGYLALRADGITSWAQLEAKLAEAAKPEPTPNPLEGVSLTHVIVRRDEFLSLLEEQRAARATLEEAMHIIAELEKKLAALEPTAVEEVSLKDHLPKAPQALALPSPKIPSFIADLPKTSRYRGVGREVRYTKAFLERLKGLNEHERKRVLERVTWITEGSNAPGLRVKPLTPPRLAERYGGKPLCARGTGDLRLVFKPNGQLEFVDILRKGDIPNTSEA